MTKWIVHLFCKIFGCHYPLVAHFEDKSGMPDFKPDPTQPCHFCGRCIYELDIFQEMNDTQNTKSQKPKE